jgi:hypothetical protein
MAQRPIFLPSSDPNQLVKTVMVEFNWFPGFSIAQKQRSVAALHAAAQTQLKLNPILEISSKSQRILGVQLSAFHLSLQLSQGKWPIEVIFQASKVFQNGGPFKDLYLSNSREARKDLRLQTSGPLIRFQLEQEDWDLEPTTSFYDWIYLQALLQNKIQLDEFEAFTDIEFNPNRSFNCQAHSAALFLSLKRRGLLGCLQNRKDYLAVLKDFSCSPKTHNAEAVQLAFDF